MLYANGGFVVDERQGIALRYSHLDMLLVVNIDLIVGNRDLGRQAKGELYHFCFINGLTLSNLLVHIRVGFFE